MSRSDEFTQGALVPGHQPADEIPTARRWAARAGRGARVHYVSPEDNPYFPGQHRLSVTVPGTKGGPRRTVSQINWSPHDGEVVLVETKQDYRERGLARGLWKIAKSFGEESPDFPRVQHGRVQTPLGQQWSRAVGD